MIRFFPDNTEPPLFWSSKLIGHLVDCRKVEEEGIIQHRHLHPDTKLSTTSLRESPIVGFVFKSMCVGVYSFVELMGTGELAFMEHNGGVYVYHA